MATNRSGQRSRCHPVGDGNKPLRPEIGKVLHHPGLQELGVELGDAVDPVAADDSEVCHAQPLVAVLGEDGHSTQTVGLAGEAVLDGDHEAAIDLVDDLYVARNQRLHH